MTKVAIFTYIYIYIYIYILSGQFSGYYICWNELSIPVGNSVSVKKLYVKCPFTYAEEMMAQW